MVPASLLLFQWSGFSRLHAEISLVDFCTVLIIIAQPTLDVNSVMNQRLSSELVINRQAKKMAKQVAEQKLLGLHKIALPVSSLTSFERPCSKIF